MVSITRQIGESSQLTDLTAWTGRPANFARELFPSKGADSGFSVHKRRGVSRFEYDRYETVGAVLTVGNL